jgi:hypothetical protein
MNSGWWASKISIDIQGLRDYKVFDMGWEAYR